MVEPYLNYAADPSSGLLYLWQNAPWAVEGVLLFIFLLPIFVYGGKKTGFEEKQLTIFAAVFAAATELSFQIIGVTFAHFTGWIILAFCIILALTAWKVLIHPWTNEKYQFSISIGVLLFTYMFSFILSIKSTSALPTLGAGIIDAWASEKWLGLLRAVSFWILIMSVLFGLNAHMGPWNIENKRKDVSQWLNQRSQRNEKSRKERQRIDSLSQALGYKVKDEISALGRYILAGEKAVDVVSKTIAFLERIQRKLAEGIRLSIQDARQIKMFTAGIDDKRIQTIESAKALLEKIKNTKESLGQLAGKIDLINYSELNKRYEAEFKAIETRLKKSKLKKHNPEELDKLKAELAQLSKLLQDLNPLTTQAENLAKERDRNLAEIKTKNLDNFDVITTDVESIIKKLSTKEQTDALNLIYSSVDKDPTETLELIKVAVAKLKDLLTNIDIEPKSTAYESQLQQLSTYIQTINDITSQTSNIVSKDLDPKQQEVTTRYLALLTSLEGHENILKQQRKVKTDVNELINDLNAEIAKLKGTYNESLNAVGSVQDYFKKHVFGGIKPKQKGSTIGTKAAIFKRIPILNQALASIDIDQNLARAVIAKLKDVADDIKDFPGHTSIASSLLAVIQTEEVRIIDNLSNFKQNTTAWINGIENKIKNQQPIDPAELKQLVNSINAEANNINDFIKDLEIFVAKLKQAQAS